MKDDLLSLNGGFVSAIWLAANENDVSELIRLLRSDRELSHEDRLYLAKYLAGELKRGRGRPKKKATDFLKEPVSTAKHAAWYAERYLRVWRKRYGGKHPIVGPGGEREAIVRAACQKAIERVERLSGGALSASARQVEDLLRRPRRRRQ